MFGKHLLVVRFDGHSARLERHFGRDQTIYDWQHYIALVERKPWTVGCTPTPRCTACCRWD